MKSLHESLFDKDLTSRNLPYFGEMYEVVRVNLINYDYIHGGFLAKQEEFLSWLKNTVRLPMLKKDFKPVKIDNKKAPVEYKEHMYDGLRANQEICEIAGYIVSLVNLIPVDEKMIKEYPGFPMSPSTLGEKIKNYLKFFGFSGGTTGSRAYFTIDQDDLLILNISRSDKEMKIIFKKK